MFGRRESSAKQSYHFHLSDCMDNNGGSDTNCFVTHSKNDIDEIKTKVTKCKYFVELAEHKKNFFKSTIGLFYFQNRLCIPTGIFRLNLSHNSHTILVTVHMQTDWICDWICVKYFLSKTLGTVLKFVFPGQVCQKTWPANQNSLRLLQFFEPSTAKRTHITMDFIPSFLKWFREKLG